MRKGSAPELFSRPDASTAVQSPAPPAQRSASASATPVLRPMAIPALKGLSFLTGRSRSNPGTPRDSKPLSVRSTVPEAGDKKEKRRVSADVYSDEKPPEVTVLSAPLADIPATPAPAYLPLPVAASPIPGGGLIDDAARVRQGASATSRSTSPGPSLSEALLRARRPATPHTPGKGTRFKSSFTGVADHVLRLGEQHQQQAQAPTSGDLKGANNNGGPSSGINETPGGE